MRHPREGDSQAIACDLSRDVDPADWAPRLQGIDAVVNCAGILREAGGATFEAVHHHAPRALFEACRAAGVRRVVQVSAIGDARDGEFIASKHRGDEALLAAGLDAVVLRPSVVYSAAGSYGGTSLLRAMACVPWVLAVPGEGTQRLQPVDRDDLAACVVGALERPEARGQVIEIVGPAELTLLEYLLAWRRWLGAGPARVLRVPQALVGIACGVGEALGRGPLGRTMQRMLARGNVGAPGAAERMHALLGVAPRSLEAALAARPAEAQDRAHASLYLLYPVAILALAFVWLGSAIAGFAAPVADLRALAVQGGLPAEAGPPLVRALSALDLALGLAVLHPRSATLAAWLMLGSVAGYTVVTGLLWPAFWLEPLGGLVKNAAILPLLLFVLAWQRPRGAS